MARLRKSFYPLPKPKIGSNPHPQPVVRRLLTRLLAIIPSMAVALAVGRDGIDVLLVASQVVLSIVLPFITFPLLFCTSSPTIMRVRNVGTESSDLSLTLEESMSVEGGPRSISQLENGGGSKQWVDFSNGKITIAVGVVIWLVVVAANMYVIVQLAMDA